MRSSQAWSIQSQVNLFIQGLQLPPTSIAFKPIAFTLNNLSLQYSGCIL